MIFFPAPGSFSNKTALFRATTHTRKILVPMNTKINYCSVCTIRDDEENSDMMMMMMMMMMTMVVMMMMMVVVVIIIVII